MNVTSADIGLLILRLVVGGVIAMHGLMKLGLVGKGGSVAGVAGWFGSLGFRPGLFWALVVIAAEVGGGLLMVLGLGGPIGPLVVAADLVMVTIVAHWSQGFWVAGGKAGWEFPVPIAAGALAVGLIGNGVLSLDAALGLRYPDRLMPVWSAIVIVGLAAALAARAIFAPRKKT